MAVTNTEERVLDFIEGYTAAKGYPPTYKEIGDALGFVKSCAHFHVANLVLKGYVTKEPRRFRTLRVIKHG